MRPAGFEPAAPSLGNLCSIRLSYGRDTYNLGILRGFFQRGVAVLSCSDVVRRPSPTGSVQSCELWTPAPRSPERRRRCETTRLTALRLGTAVLHAIARFKRRRRSDCACMRTTNESWPGAPSGHVSGLFNASGSVANCDRYSPWGEAELTSEAREEGFCGWNGVRCPAA